MSTALCQRLEAPLHRFRQRHGEVGFQLDPLPLRASPLARSLAMGHFCVHLVESGKARDYGQVAARFGISQARVSHMVQLTLLAPDIQADLLQGRIPLRSQALRRLAGKTAWIEQRISLRAFLEKRLKLRAVEAVSRDLDLA